MTEEKIKTLWTNYKRTNDRTLRNQIIEHYASLVKIVAGKLMITVGEHVEYDDLCSIGVFGLIDAIDKYDLSKNIKFETYASLRIRGAILDELRKSDLVPRTVRLQLKTYEKAKHELYLSLGRNPIDEEIRDYMNLSEEEYKKFLLNLPFTSLISLDEQLETGNQTEIHSFHQNPFETPEENIDKQQLKENLQQALEQLTEREKNVILLVYYEDLTMKEVSQILEITESRVSQLHSKALIKMRPYLDLT